MAERVLSDRETERMNTVAKIEPAPLVRADAASIMDVISRAASDPNTDVDKLERLLGLYERITDRQAKASYTQALTAVQGEMPDIKKRGQIKNKSLQVQSTYALWEDINDAIQPILARHGFALSFRTGFENGKTLVTGILSHKDGHSEETTIYLPADTSGSKNDVQAVGSSTSYGKRYTAGALLNMTFRGEDDDGNKAGIGDKITDKQAGEIRNLLAQHGKDIEKFCNYMHIEAVPDLLARDYDRAVAAITKGARK